MTPQVKPSEAQLDEQTSLHEKPLDTRAYANDSTGPKLAPAHPTNSETNFPFLSPPEGAGELGRLAAYRVLKKLGEGGMGFVFGAEDIALRRPVALKVMRPEIASHPEAAERFLREGRAAAGLKSDHIITIYHVGEANGVPYLAMEFLEGNSLDQWMKAQKKAIPLPHVLRIVRDTLRGLASAHEKGLIHRDIKPANLWIEKGTSRTKLLDFGLTRGNEQDVQLTQDGAVIGTPAYMAPEQASGLPIDARADLFSVGTVMFHLLAGKNPFKRDSIVSTLHAVAMQPHESLQSIRSDVPAEIAEFLDRLLAKQPSKRPNNAKAALAELLAIEKSLLEQKKEGDSKLPSSPVSSSPAFPQIDTKKSLATSASALPSASGRKPPIRALLIGGGAFAFFAGIFFTIVIIITNKDGTKTRIEIPEGAKVEIQKDGDKIASIETSSPVTSPDSKASDKSHATLGTKDPDRRAAEFFLSKGGIAYVGDTRVTDVASLPSTPFKVTGLWGETEKAINSDELEVLKGLTELTSLKIRGPIADQDVNKISQLPFAAKLSEFVILDAPITDECFNYLAKFPNLSILLLVRAKNVVGTQVSQLKATKISHLGLAGTSLSEEGLQQIQENLPTVSTLDIELTPTTDSGMRFVGKMTNLHNLQMGLCNEVTDEGFKHLETCQNLDRIVFLNPKLTGACFQTIAKLKNLLVVNNNWIEGQSIALTDEELHCILNAPKLESLSFNTKNITDRGLETLAQIKTLKTFYIAASKTTPEGLAKFKAALPECKVIDVTK